MPANPNCIGHPASHRLAWLEPALLLFLCAAVWLAYAPGLNGPFLFDDFQNITRNAQIAISDLSPASLLGAAFSQSSGIFGRQIPMLSFALNYYFAGESFSPFAFKATNLAIHTVNVVLVFFLVRQLFLCRVNPTDSVFLPGSQKNATVVAAVSAAVWGLHPIQLTSVLYIVQRMTSLSALFVLLGLLVYLHGRKRLHDAPGRGLVLMTTGLVSGVVFGFLCKENAVLLPLMIMVVEGVFFSRRNLEFRTRRYLGFFYLGFVAVPFVLACAYLILNPGFIESAYASRNFGMWERLLTQFRVLFFYLGLFVFPLLSRFGLYHDDFAISTGIMDPPATLIALVAWILLAALTVRGFRQHAIWAFGLGWFIAGHMLESTIIGLEIVHEHRNYVPSIGIAAAAVYYFLIFFRKVSGNLRLGAVAGVCALTALCFVTFVRASTWSSRPLLFQMMARNHPDSYRAQLGKAVGMTEEGRDIREIYGAYRDAALVNPRTVHSLLEMTKIVYALAAAIVPSPAEDGTNFTGGLSEPAPWNSDLRMDRRFLQQLSLALKAEIKRRLRAGTTHIETVNSLITLQKCLSSRQPHCLPFVDQILEWHRLALLGIPPGGRGRDLLELSMARLFAEKGELEVSLDYFDKAIESSGDDPRYRIRKALFLVSMGRRDEARMIADQVQGEMDWRQQFSTDMKVLRQALEGTAPAAFPGADSTDASGAAGRY